MTKTPKCKTCGKPLKIGGDFREGQTAFYYCNCERCAKCGGKFESHHWKYGKSDKMYHTNCFLKDNTRLFAMIKNTVEKNNEKWKEKIKLVIQKLKKSYSEDCKKVGYRLTRDKISLGFNKALKDIEKELLKDL